MTETNEPTYRAAVLGCIFCGSSLSPITWKGKDDLGPLYAEPIAPDARPIAWVHVSCIGRYQAKALDHLQAQFERDALATENAK